MMQQQMYNPYGGYSFGGYSPYMQGGGYGAFNPYYGFGNPFGGQGMQGFGQAMFNPYQNFFSGFEQKLNELLANYQKQFGEQTPTTPNVSAGSSNSTPFTSPATNEVSNNVPGPAQLSQTPAFGNLGANLNKGKTISKESERKLNTMGYTGKQINEAAQGGTQAAFQEALGKMTPIGTKLSNKPGSAFK